MSDVGVNFSLFDSRSVDLSDVIRDGKELGKSFFVLDRFNLVHDVLLAARLLALVLRALLWNFCHEEERWAR